MAIPKMTSFDEIYNNELSHLPDFPLAWFKHFIAWTSGTIGFPSDQVRFLLVCISFLFLGSLFRFVPGKFWKNVYCLTLGFSGTWIIMGVPALNVLISSALTYAAVEIFMPRSPKWLKKGDVGYDKEKVYKEKLALYEKRQVLGRVVFWGSMVYICTAHIYRYISDYLGYRLDFTAAQMLLTIKISAYAWNRVDGETLNDGIQLTDIRGDQEYRMERAIHERPSMLQYFAWVYHFTSCLAGPSIDYREYEMYLDGSLWKQYGLEELPSTTIPAMKKFMYCLLSYPGVFILATWPLSRYVGTEQFFINHPYAWQRALYVMIVNGFSRFKYYFAWYLAEAASTATGIGISGYDKSTGEVFWDRCNGSRAWLIESCTGVSDLIISWNIRCSEWLKHYVFLRTKLPAALKGKISERTFADLTTKFTSAFWHGVYPGYYMFFLQVFFLNTFQSQLDKLLKPFFFKENPENPRKPIKQYPIGWVYNAIMNVFTLWSFAWLGSAFVLLEFTPVWELLYSTYFWYHIGFYVLLILLPKMLCPKKKTAAPKAVDGAEPTSPTSPTTPTWPNSPTSPEPKEVKQD